MAKEIPKTAKPGAQPVYQNKPLQAHVEDSYKSRGKLGDGTLCPKCGAVFHAGRWRWLPKPEQAQYEAVCPACHRIADGVAAGYVRLEGKFLAQHREEILQLMGRVELKEKAEHPLQRIMDIVDDDGAVLVTTTDTHLARGIGEAVRHAYQGHLEFKFGGGENLIRVHWQR